MFIRNNAIMSRRRVCVECGRSYLDGALGRCDACAARLRRKSKRHKQRTCSACSAVFATTRADARFCSGSCRQRNHRACHRKDAVA
jgi:hypothetical protein